MEYTYTAPNCSPLFLYCTKQGFELSQTARNSPTAQTVSLVWIILKPLFWQYYESCAMFGSVYVHPIMAVIIKHNNIFYYIIINNHYQSGYIYKCWQNIAEILSFCRNMGYRIIQSTRLFDPKGSFEYFVIIHKHISCKIKIVEQF